MKEILLTEKEMVFFVFRIPCVINTYSIREATSKTWTRTLDPDPEKPGPLKNWTLKNLDPKKPGP